MGSPSSKDQTDDRTTAHHFPAERGTMRLAGGVSRPRKALPGPVVVARHARFSPAGIPAEKLEAGRSVPRMGSPGRSTLLLGPPSAEPYRIFRALSRGKKGLVMSGAHPGRLRTRYGLAEAELLWLTGLSTNDEVALGPQDLEYEVLGRAVRHFRAERGALIFLDDIDYLASQDGFDALARFVKGVSDAASELGGSFMAIADPQAFSDRQKLALMECFDGVRLLRGPQGRPARADRAILVRHGAYLLRSFGPEAYRFLGMMSRTHGVLCMTTLPPSKLKERYGLQGVEFCWLSDSASGEGVMRPRKLGYEVQRAATRHLRSRPGALLYLDGLERLGPYAPFPEIVRFVKSLVDASGESGGILVASMHPGFFGRAEEAVLRKRFDTVLA